jgi:hypothetical protein
LSVHPFTWLGVFLILLGVALVLIPVLGQYVDLSKVPSWLIYVYRSNGFYFVTSPLLILLSVISLIVFILRRAA